MRNITMISTKDHFLYVASCEHSEEEVYSETTGQNITFVSEGSLSSFRGGEGNWTQWSNNHTLTSPILVTRADNTTFGCVASSDNSLMTVVVPKELSVSGNWDEHTRILATDEEVSLITLDSNNAFVIAEQCIATAHRDLDTYAHILANTATITDSEITIV
jgi:hypothetical protein